MALSVHALPSQAERLEASLSRVTGVLNRAHAELVEVVAEVVETGAWDQPGMVSPIHWLVLRAGLSRARAQQVVAIARRRHELGATLRSLSAGLLTLDQVAVIARHSPAEYEASVADLAQFATVPQLRRAVARYVFDADPNPVPVGESVPGPEPEDPGVVPGVPPPEHTPDQGSPHSDPAADPACLSMFYDERGRFVLRYDAPAHVGAVVETAIREAKDALFTSLGRASTHAEAFVTLARRSLASMESVARREMYRLYVHLDTDGSWLTGRPRLPRHVTDTITCDGVLQPVWETDGHPVNVGRAQRIVPHRTRRLVLDRDRGCRYPGCPTTAAVHLDVHHIRHWRHDGPTDTHNLIALCTRHHDRHHAGDFEITGNPDQADGSPDGLTFTTGHGHHIRYLPPGGSPDPATKEGPWYPGPTGERLHTRHIHFTQRPSTPCS